MNMVQYAVGDATAVSGSDGPKVIAHVCNDIGGWGRGFVASVSQRWKAPEAAYRTWYRERGRPGNDFALGAVQLVPVEDGIWVANMIGQRGIARRGRTDAPIRYEALATALTALATHCNRLGASAHLPRIGCGLAGGTWDRVEPLLTAHLVARGIATTVHDVPVLRSALPAI
ncbi:Appr-1-p processing protein [Streptomyces sp. NPDC053079]|uniref:Appr-1-p processing protein n=1 Tax=Streptomyces sp. NPDC053079 TaxID=3365697 RepID=UPI0037CE843D